MLIWKKDNLKILWWCDELIKFKINLYIMGFFRDFIWKDYDNICKNIYIYIYKYLIILFWSDISLIWVLFFFCRLSMNRRKKEEERLRKRIERLFLNNNLLSIDFLIELCLINYDKKLLSDYVKVFI